MDRDAVARFIRAHNENMTSDSMAKALGISPSMITRVRSQIGIKSPRMEARRNSTKDSDEMIASAMSGRMSLDGLRHPW
ncbi:hypothetical protein [Neptunomonas antarctica]|uniref:hypothetical protein n=1 Tax=Neptunomonas antarctica TaxID=619304 RepID=UPI00138EDDD8|nr:hypothetical protein [Neptunomonas antarctica]